MIPGDANSDQYVDGLDQTIWIGLNGFGGFYNADFNGDGYVDGLDQTLWIINNGLGSICAVEHFIQQSRNTNNKERESENKHNMEYDA